MWLQDVSVGMRVSSSLSTQPGIAEGRRRGSCCCGKCWPRRSAALAPVFVRSLFELHGSRCDQDSPINPALVILFCSPPPISLWPSPDFTLVPFLF